MTTSLSNQSSWLASMSYKSFPDGVAYLALFLKPYKQANGIESEAKAYLFGGPGVELPSWLPGLIAAGRARKADGKLGSPGAVFHRLVKEKYQGQMVKGEDVARLKEMMK